MAVNRALLVHFVKVMTTDMLKKKFSVIAPKVGKVLDWVSKVNIPAGRSIYNFMEKNADTRSMPLKKSMFGRSPDPVLNKIGTEHVQQILRASLSIGT